VGAQPPHLGVQAAEVDDPADAANASRGREVLRVRAVEGLEVRARSQGVDEVVGDVDPAQGLREAVGVGGVAQDDLHPVVPLTVGQVPGPTGHDPNAEVGREQPRDQATADVSRSARNQHEWAGVQGTFRRHGTHLTVGPGP
jgi:hypothetical protein